MDELILFTDGSVDPKSNIGYGAYLALPFENPSLDILKSLVRVKRFEQTSSTKLELETLLWALEQVSANRQKILVYTDSQNIIGLPKRRGRLERSDYYSKKHKRIKNYELYQKFYGIMDRLDCSFFKIKGHKSSRKKDEMDQFFTLVDRASRNALRKNPQ